MVLFRKRELVVYVINRKIVAKTGDWADRCMMWDKNTGSNTRR
jgi:hypothetical protein